jgi:hypothetical protein
VEAVDAAGLRLFDLSAVFTGKTHVHVQDTEAPILILYQRS